MAIIATAGDSKLYTPAPVGAHQAVCVDVIDKGIVEVTYAGKTKKQHKISLAWQIDETRDDGKRFLVYKRYTLSLNEKATLRKDLESWRGKAFTRDEEMGFDVEQVLRRELPHQRAVQRLGRQDVRQRRGGDAAGEGHDENLGDGLRAREGSTAGRCPERTERADHRRRYSVLR
jgi:hypothetical protein